MTKTIRWYHRLGISYNPYWYRHEARYVRAGDADGVVEIRYLVYYMENWRLSVNEYRPRETYRKISRSFENIL